MNPRRLLMDTSPLRESPTFRALWTGDALSSIGGQMTFFAVTLQTYTLTHSSLAVGGLGLAMALPAILLGLLGGTLIDSLDRRTLVLATTIGLAATSLAFALQALADLHQLWLLYTLLAAQSLLNAINGPARRAFLPRLLPTHRLAAAAALTALAMHTSVTIGPALAGLIAATGGLTTCYLIDVASFAAALYGISRLPAMPPDPDAGRPGPRAVLDGLRFLARSRTLIGALTADLNATVLGMPIALFPAINAAHFGGTAQTLGLLSAGPAIGGILGSALSGPLRHIHRPGRAMLAATALWGATLAAFGLAHTLPLALGLLIAAGAADVTSVIFRTTIVATATPDRYRGRVSAAEYIVGTGCPQLGNFRAGLVATLTTPATSAVTGGLTTILGAAAIRLALPAFTRYRTPVTQPATT